MGLFDVFKNKSGRSSKTHTNLGQKYVTEHRKTKTGITTKVRPIKSTTTRKKK